MDDQNQSADDSAEREEYAPDISCGMMPFPAHAFATMNGVGPALSAAVETAERFMRPDIVAITEPGTGLEVFVEVTQDGVQAIPESIFDEYRTEPKHRRGTAVLLSLDSFIDHVNRFSDADTAIFADNDRAKPSLTAVLDYHKAGSTEAARFGRHRSSFGFPLSDEWKAWNGHNAQPMKNVEFAGFLEDRIIDVMPGALVNLTDEAQLFVDTLGGKAKIADPAKLMEIATQLKILENSVVNNVTNLSSGEAQIEFQSEHLDQRGEKLNLPTMFVIGIPVFKNGPIYQIIARFRYRKTGATVVFWYELWRTDRVFDHAFDESVERVKQETERPVFLGRDESKQPA